MIVIVCIDDQNGMLFNKRRQSRDILLVEDILKTVGDRRLFVDGFSKSLFSSDNRVFVSDDFLGEANDGDFCFVEDRDIHEYIEKTEGFVVYKWNRLYPSDFKFDISLLDGFHMKSITDFKGNSHDKITQEVYVR